MSDRQRDDLFQWFGYTGEGCKVLRWLRFADEDLRAAREMSTREHFTPRHICFLSQQAAEKVLKALLLSEELRIPRTHDLEAIVALLPIHIQEAFSSIDLERLTVWAVESRYPGEWDDATADDANTALQTATQIWQVVLTELTRNGFLKPFLEEL